MGWDQKDAVGEVLQEGDRVKVFRNFSGDEDCTPIVGHTGVVEGLEQGSYRGRLAVLVYTDGGGGYLGTPHVGDEGLGGGIT